MKAALSLPRLPLIAAVTKRILRSLRHDRRTMALMLVAPCLVMFVFGFALSGEVENVELIIVDEDQGVPWENNTTLDLSDAIGAKLDRDTLDITTETQLQAAITQVEDGKAWGVVHFPANFTAEMAAALSSEQGPGDSPTIPDVILYLDRSNTNVAQAVVNAVREAVLKALEDQGASGASIEVDPVYAGDADFIDMFIPGVMAFAGFLLTLILTLLSFVGERNSGTLARLRVSPLTETELVLGYALSYGLMAIVQSMVLLLVAMLFFHIAIEGSILLAFLVVVLLAMASQALGILLSSAARSEAQAVQFFPLIVLPTFLLAGIFWPVEAVPSWLRPVSHLIPPTYAVSALRSVFLRGWGVSQIWTELLALLGFLAVFVVGSIVQLKRE